MAEEKKVSKGKEFFTKHGEKLGLGVAALALVGYLVVGILMATDDPSDKRVGIEAGRLEGEKQKRHEKDVQIPDAQPWMNDAIGPWNTVVKGKSETPPDNWVASITTEIKYTEIAKPKEKPIIAVAPTISMGELQVNLDHVVVSWSMKDLSPAEANAAKKKGENPVKLSHFKLERRIPGKAWELLTETKDVKTLTFKDTKIDPKTRYEYQVTAFTADPIWLKATNNANKDNRVMTVATDAPAQTLGIWKLTFRSPSRPENAQKGGMVQVVIEKFEKALGRKVTTSRIHYDGDKIGWWPDGGEAEPVSKHKTFEGGKAYTVDFDTGATLVSVMPKKVTLEIKKCKAVYGEGGAKERCDTVTEKRNFDVYEIFVKDDEGDKKFLSPNPRETPNGQDQFCEDHGGKKIITTLPGTAPQNPAVPEPPKVDPAAELAKKKEAEAEKLWKDAEKALAADNKKAAVAIYEKLLGKDYAATDFVAKGKKAVIEERLATLNK